MAHTKFDQAYMNIAAIWSQNSSARRRKVGCIIVKDNRIISDGYNGTPSGFDNNCEDEDPTTMVPITDADGVTKMMPALVTKREVLHSESNAITKLARGTESSEGATMYVTLQPCFECAKLIIQSGIKRLVYGEEYRDKSGCELLRKAGVEVDYLPPTIQTMQDLRAAVMVQHPVVPETRPNVF